MTACGALVGTYIGSIVGAVYMNECLAFTSGGFLYLSLNGLMNELKDVHSVTGMIACMLSLVLGCWFMFVFALFE